MAKKEKTVRGTFNKEVLLNTKFTDTKLFSPAANQKRKTGFYCEAPYGTKGYNVFWDEEERRCLEGYENPVTGVRITGYHYFFLNYKQLEIVVDVHNDQSPKDWDFPRFWAIHWHFFHALEEAEKAGKHFVVLKPRGTGFSEIFSCMGVRDYTLKKKSKSAYFASHKDYFIKDGILTKAWENMEFLNKESQRGFKHLRQQINQTFHRRASRVDANDNEHWTGGEIFGRVVDNPNKVRGGRNYKIYYEEGGSFPRVDEAWGIARPTVEQGGITTGTMILWGTGGEEGPGISGLEDIFKNPKAYNCLGFDNCWEEAVGKAHGFFFPVWACMDKFMDEDGNPDFNAAKQFHDAERDNLRVHSPTKEDKYIAEYPYTPSEALLRKGDNGFPVAELQRQLNYVENSPEVEGMLKYGALEVGPDGKVKFILKPSAIPINYYPHKQSSDLKSAVVILEAPLKDEMNFVPDNLYQVVVDPFYKDDAEDLTSLGAIYIYKKRNNIFSTEDDLLVAWYTGRPKTTRELHQIVFKFARYYNARVQSEIGGGGQNLLDYARQFGFLQYCDYEPTMFSNNKEVVRQRNRSYFINVSADYKRDLLAQLNDWLLTERALKVEGEKTTYVLNLHKIYDKGLLQELIKFKKGGNFDRVSALLVLMAVRREIEQQEIEVRKKNQNSFFDRPMFTDTLYRSDNRLSMDEMLPGSNMDKISKGIPINE